MTPVTTLTSSVRRSPICGLLATLTPLIGGVLILFYDQMLVAAVAGIPTCLVLGIVFALAAWFRRERHLFLPVIGFVCNTALLALVLERWFTATLRW